MLKSLALLSALTALGFAETIQFCGQAPYYPSQVYLTKMTQTKREEAEY